MIPSVVVWDRVLLLSWPLRLIWLLMLAGAMVNLVASRLSNVEPRWRKLYVWKATVCLLSVVYFTISIFGLLGPGVLISLLRWVFPLYAASMCISGMMHLFEWKALKEELSKRSGA